VSKVLVLAAGLENVLEQLEEDTKEITRIKVQQGNKMEIRLIIEVHRSMVFLLMRAPLSISPYCFSFFLCFVRLFCALAFYILFLTKVSQKQDTTQEYKKQFSSVC
jgi:hypothetical protein